MHSPTMAAKVVDAKEIAVLDDVPVQFGYKCGWLALRSTSPESVVRLLALAQVRPAGWNEGIDAAYEGKVFVSPPVRGWVLVVSRTLGESDFDKPPHAILPLVKNLSAETKGVVQFFSSHRVVEYHTWIWAENGQIRRAFAWVGESGQILLNDGTPTPVERNRHLVYKDVAELLERERFPGEEDVMAVAGQWSLDPTSFDNPADHVGTGFLGELVK